MFLKLKLKGVFLLKKDFCLDVMVIILCSYCLLYLYINDKSEVYYYVNG